MGMKPRLERWIQHNNCIVGYIFDSPLFSPGTRIITEALRYIDASNFEAECLDGSYKLGTPGTAEEHNQPLLGAIKDAPEGKIILNEGDYLNPNG